MGSAVQKPRLIKDYDKLDEAVREQLKLIYPYGFSQNLITFQNREGKNVRGLRLETEDKIYLIRMTAPQAEIIIEDDDDYDDDGNLRAEIRDSFEDKYPVDELTELNESDED